jgi:hypothetical protein
MKELRSRQFLGFGHLRPDEFWKLLLLKLRIWLRVGVHLICLLGHSASGDCNGRNDFGYFFDGVLEAFAFGSLAKVVYDCERIFPISCGPRLHILYSNTRVYK